MYIYMHIYIYTYLLSDFCASQPTLSTETMPGDLSA